VRKEEDVWCTAAQRAMAGERVLSCGRPSCASSRSAAESKQNRHRCRRRAEVQTTVAASTPGLQGPNRRWPRAHLASKDPTSCFSSYVVVK
jgi:hypothetical protein